MTRSIGSEELQAAALLTITLKDVEAKLAEMFPGFEFNLGKLPLYTHRELIGHVTPGDDDWWEYLPTEQ